MTTADTPIFPSDMMAILGITHSKTLRKHIKNGKVPPPDVQLSQKTRYWWRSTLVRAGLVDSNIAAASDQAAGAKN